MPTFQVFISGENVLMDVDGELERYGFEVTRFIHASDKDQAAERALAVIRESPQMTLGPRNDPHDPPRWWVTNVEHRDAKEIPLPQQPGFAFRAEDA